MPSRHHRNIPKTWIRLFEAAHRLGLPGRRIGVWAKLGYFKRYNRGQISYVCWEEMLRNKLVRQQLKAFHDELDKDLDDELIVRSHNDPVSIEPMYEV